MTYREANAIALLGGYSVVGQALALLLRGAGYHTKILDSPPTGPADHFLLDVDLVLITPGLSVERREENLDALRMATQNRSVPMLELSSIITDAPPGNEVRTVPWPTSIQRLADEIEASLKASVRDAEGVY